MSSAIVNNNVLFFLSVTQQLGTIYLFLFLTPLVFRALLVEMNSRSSTTSRMGMPLSKQPKASVPSDIHKQQDSTGKLSLAAFQPL